MNPAWLVENERGPSVAPFEPGELVVFDSAPPLSERRIGVVVGVDDRWSILLVHLATPDVEFATDLDVIIDDPMLPFELLVEAEIYGPIFIEQVETSIGRLDPAVAEAISRSVQTDGESVVRWARATPLAGEGDVRRAFKRSELDELDDYTRAARSWITEGPSLASTIDLDLLVLEQAAQDPVEMVVRAAAALSAIRGFQADGRMQPLEMVEQLVVDGTLDDMDGWRKGAGVDMARELSRIPFDPATSLLVESGGDRRARGMGALIQRLADRGATSIDVYSAEVGSDDAVLIGSGSSVCRVRFRSEGAPS